MCQIPHVISKPHVSLCLNLDHSSASWKIILLYFFSSNIIYFGQNEPIKVQIFEILECFDPNSSNSSYRSVNSSSNFSSFFSVITHNSAVNFQLMHILLWKKRSHQIPVLTLSSSLVKMCQIPRVIFQTTSQFFFKFCITLRWKITSLYFFRPNVIYFAQKESIKVNIFETFECLGQKLSNSCHYWNNRSVFLQTLHHSSMSWNITPLYFFSWNFTYFQQKERMKVQIWWNFTWKVESLIFYTLMGSFCSYHIKFQLKKV